MSMVRWMRCCLAGRLLDEYAEGELRPPRRSRVERHLADCERCRLRLQRLQEALKALSALPREQLPLDFAARVMSAVRLAQGLPERVGRRLYHLWAAGAAAATALVIVIGLMLHPGPPQQQSALASEQWRQLAVDFGYEEGSALTAAIEGYSPAASQPQKPSIEEARACEEAGFIAGAAERYAEAVFGSVQEVQ